MTELFPILKLNQPSLLSVHRGLPIKTVVVRLQDLISSTYKFNSVLSKIKKAGGIHNYLGFHGKVILSLIMRDDILPHFTAEKYSLAINLLKPNFYTTPDCETYEGEIIKLPDGRIFYGNVEKSFNQILKVLSITKKLISLCPNSMPLGQVKGCNNEQLKFHMVQLNSLGIYDFVFHVGDFFRHGNPTFIQKAKVYSTFIKRRSRSLMLYGMGSQKKLNEYSFGDAYASMNYFIKARRGQEYTGTKLRRANGRYSPVLARKNLIQMLKNIDKVKHQTKLIDYMEVPAWEEDIVSNVPAMPEAVAMAIEIAH